MNIYCESVLNFAVWVVVCFGKYTNFELLYYQIAFMES